MGTNRLGALSSRLGGMARRLSVASYGKSRGGSSSIAPQTGLDFTAFTNGVANGDMRVLWNGANLLPRTAHTAVWKARFVQQTGYYQLCVHSSNTGTWEAGDYEYLNTPYPASDGAVDANGHASNPTGASGTVHFFEIAGLSANDFLASPGGGPGLQKSNNVWYSQARKCEVISGTTMRHTFWPDLDGTPSFSIVQDVPLANLESPSAPAFYFGASDWTSSGGANDETPGCVLRHIMLYDRGDMSLSEVQAKLALTADDTTDPDVWYSNLNPTHTDVSDKSGAGHSPSWANANRPTTWTA